MEINPYQVLASGIDKLVLAIDVEWLNTVFFDELAEKKAEAREEGTDVLFTMILLADEKEEWKTQIKPHGTAGYEWLLIGKDFSWIIGNWQKPKTRPSMMVEIHSETLWRMGYEKAVETIRLLIMAYGGKIITIKPSRIDMCLDMLIPEKEWNHQIKKNIVTRAVYYSEHYNLQADKLEGISIGKGVVSARLYDKPFEINKSKKEWMYDIWGIEKVPDDYKVIRTEFQLRREAIKELGINVISDFNEKIQGLWSYCTEKWLSFKDHPEKHHSLRTPLPWWQAVQDGFSKDQKTDPLIRRKAFNVEEKQLFCQGYGLIRSLQALKFEKLKATDGKKQTLLSSVLEFCDLASVYGKNDEEFFLDVETKRSKYQRLRSEQITN